MKLGNIDTVLNVADIEASREFYEKLGFQSVSSDVPGGLAVLVLGAFRLVLMRGHVQGNMLNLRPSNMSKVLPELKRRFPSGTVMSDGESFDLRDPDGNNVYICQDH